VIGNDALSLFHAYSSSQGHPLTLTSQSIPCAGMSPKLTAPFVLLPMYQIGAYCAELAAPR
jgi:hypothetical protein